MHCELHPVYTTAEGNSKKYIFVFSGGLKKPVTLSWLESIYIQFLILTIMFILFITYYFVGNQKFSIHI